MNGGFKKGIAVTAVVFVVALGTLVWARFKPAFTQGSPSVTVAIPAWGTTGVTASGGAGTGAAGATSSTVTASGGTATATVSTADGKSQVTIAQPRKPKAQTQARKRQDRDRNRSVAQGSKATVTQQSSLPSR